MRFFFFNYFYTNLINYLTMLSKLSKSLFPRIVDL